MSIKKKKILLLHFQPIELYPPTTNLIDFLTKQNNYELLIISNSLNIERGMGIYDIQSASIKIIRPSTNRKNFFFRHLHYFGFYCKSIFYIIRFQPDFLIYYETISSFPAIFYKFIIKRKVQLMVHYHEYTSIAEYKEGMILNKWFHKLERFLYSKYSWISHTNVERMTKFRKDILREEINECVYRIIPNYPPKTWVVKKKVHNDPIKLVYVGSLSNADMYLVEIVEWIINYDHGITLDIFSHNIKNDSLDYLEGIKNSKIKFKGSICYKSLPNVLIEYDVGLILYKATSDNYIFNAPNKLFEYLACGLDVWFPKEMTFSHNYKNVTSNPRVIPINYTRMSEFDFDTFYSRKELSFKPSIYFYENIYFEFVKFFEEN